MSKQCWHVVGERIIALPASQLLCKKPLSHRGSRKSIRKGQDGAGVTGNAVTETLNYNSLGYKLFSWHWECPTLLVVSTNLSRSLLYTALKHPKRLPQKEIMKWLWYNLLCQIHSVKHSLKPAT